MSAIVLIAEDDPLAIKAIESKLSALGIEVFCAKDGSVAIEALKKERYDAVVLDMHMPGKNGVSVVQEMHETINKDTPVFVVSNDAGDDMMETMHNLGIEDYFVKSVQPLSAVIDAITKKLEERSSTD